MPFLLAGLAPSLRYLSVRYMVFLWGKNMRRLISFFAPKSCGLRRCSLWDPIADIFQIGFFFRSCTKAVIAQKRPRGTRARQIKKKVVKNSETVLSNVARAQKEAKRGSELVELEFYLIFYTFHIIRQNILQPLKAEIFLKLPIVEERAVKKPCELSHNPTCIPCQRIAL